MLSTSDAILDALELLSIELPEVRLPLMEAIARKWIAGLKEQYGDEVDVDYAITDDEVLLNFKKCPDAIRAELDGVQNA